MQQLAPIALFTYNRLDHTKQTVEALQKNELAEQSKLFIFSDGPKNETTIDSVNKVRQYIRNINGFKSIEIIESKTNKGLANSIIEGVSKIINEYEKIIVVEDDIVTSKGFLKYMNQSLEIYQEEKKVMEISGYMYPLKKNKLPETFFYPAAHCWGWATWKRAWEKFNSNAEYLYEQIQKRNLINILNINTIHNFEWQLKANITGDLHTWYIKWLASIILENGYVLYPKYSLVQNVGFDNSGEHCGTDNRFINNKLSENIIVKKQKIEYCKEAIEVLKKFGEKPKLKSPNVPLKYWRYHLSKILPKSITNFYHKLKKRK